MPSADVIVAAINMVRIRQQHHPLALRQEVLADKLEGILQGVGIDVKTIVGDTIVDMDALHASGIDVDALAADLKRILIQEQ